MSIPIIHAGAIPVPVPSVMPTSNFQAAYEHTAKFEGGWVFHKSDPGGETYCGISRRAHPNWEGWKLVDEIPGKKTGFISKNPVLVDLVHDFYRVNYWNRVKGDQIHDARVAGFIFDFSVNSGGAIKVVQKVVEVTQDGKVGPRTIEAINNLGSDLLSRLIAARKRYIADLIRADKKLEVFRTGWLNRINSFA